jgi:hypothetical protein
MILQELFEADAPTPVQEKSRTQVYLDMDGVLADFFEEYAKLAGNPKDGSGRYNYRNIPAAKTDPTLNKMVGTDFFYRLPKFPTTDALVSLVVKIFGSYNICSSPLRGDHENSAVQKRRWLQDNLAVQPQEVIITPQKQKYAVQSDGTPNILIDDRGSNITAWEAAGGVGIKYQADEDSLLKNNDASFLQFSRKRSYRINEHCDIPLKDIRNSLGLRSTYFNAVHKNGQIVLSGRGFGHGAGLCQDGAIRMSKLNYSYKSILHFYYQNVSIVHLDKLDFFKFNE